MLPEGEQNTARPNPEAKGLFLRIAHTLGWAA